MPVRSIAILSPGDMGHAVGRALGESGFRVVTCLLGRSERTRKLARRANIEDLPSLEKLALESDLILSIVPPANATYLATQVADAIRITESNVYYADCNAVSPETVKNINSIISASGGRFIDASIIGGPPGKGGPPRFYASGSYTNIMLELDGKGIKVRPMGGEIGRASAMKMCYSALTKGSQALWITLLTAAEIMGLSDELRLELLSSRSAVYKDMERQIPGVAAKSQRWVGEMKEIASTFENIGLPGDFHLAAAEIFNFVGHTPLAEETNETLDPARTLMQTIDLFAKRLRENGLL
jgi:3-hydroxyisobutyrate dehydrogenase-like beta-hydroxyacid dehydrogenase